MQSTDIKLYTPLTFCVTREEMISNPIHKLEHEIHMQYINRLQALTLDENSNQSATNIWPTILDCFRIPKCLYLALPQLDLSFLF